jgi:hypothetical protein
MHHRMRSWRTGASPSGTLADVLPSSRHQLSELLSKMLVGRRPDRDTPCAFRNVVKNCSLPGFRRCPQEAGEARRIGHRHRAAPQVGTFRVKARGLGVPPLLGAALGPVAQSCPRARGLGDLGSAGLRGSDVLRPAKRRQCHCRARYHLKIYFVYRFTATLDYSGSALLAPLLARLVAIFATPEQSAPHAVASLVSRPMSHTPAVLLTHNGWVGSAKLPVPSVTPSGHFGTP